MLFRKINKDLSSQVIHSLIGLSKWDSVCLAAKCRRRKFVGLCFRYSILHLYSKRLNTMKFIPHLNEKLDQNICGKDCWQVLLRQVCKLSFCLKNNSLFLWKPGTFQRLSSFNEPQCCASVCCWVSGMVLVIMCPAECLPCVFHCYGDGTSLGVFPLQRVNMTFFIYLLLVFLCLCGIIQKMINVSL